VECNDKVNQDLLGHQGITESNMFVYMGMVEQRINEILQAYAFIQSKKHQPMYDVHGQNISSSEQPPVGSMEDIRK
jgi:hypothetical protein